MLLPYDRLKKDDRFPDEVKSVPPQNEVKAMESGASVLVNQSPATTDENVIFKQYLHALIANGMYICYYNNNSHCKPNKLYVYLPNTHGLLYG